ncbi:Cytochrome P450-like protein 3 [Elsinoe fawcettii]|nr:Cytochrome P450-like protein 3 [Elsinoe fawcettii]
MDARLVIVFLVFTAATSSRLVYLLFFHPLASFPGPRLAAVTRLWLFFYEIRGCGHQKIAELHQELGKSVRIGPDELSFLDVDTYYDEVYTQSTKFMKEPRFYRAFDNPGASLFTRTMRFDHASMKRLMSHAFSRSNVIALVPMLHRNTHAWISKLKSHVSKNGKIPLWHATQCLTLDNASCFSYGSAEGAIESDDFHHPLFKGFDNFAPMVVVFQHFPWMQTLAHLILHHIPAFRSINRGSATGFDRLRHTRVPGKEGLIMFESMLMKADKSRVILKADETISEGALMLVAGTGTTAAALTTAIYHLTRRPEIWKELRSQISSALSESSNHIDVVQLESVALLKAVIMESLRVAVPIRGRHPRVVPQGGWRYDGKILPHGVSLFEVE